MSAKCAHCQSSYSPSAPSDLYCCTGCAAAHEWIREAGLLAYYQLRSDHAAVPVSNRLDDPNRHLTHFDRTEVLAKYAQQTERGLRITLSLRGIRCAACAWLIESCLDRQPGVFAAHANAITGVLELQFDPTQRALSELLRSVEQLGYTAYLGQDARQTELAERARRAWLMRLGVALIAAVQAMMFSEALYLDFSRSMSLETRDFLRWLSFLMTTPVVFYSGFSFLRGAYFELRARALGMDVLIASSVLLAYFASVVETIRGGAQVYYDAAAMFVLLLLIARAVEARARTHAQAAAVLLTRSLPELAERQSSSGALEWVSIHALQPGDIVYVRAGEALAVDAELIAAPGSRIESISARLDEAAISGESEPVSRLCGEALCAGSIALEPLWARCRSRAEDSWLPSLGRLAQQQRQRLPIETRLLAYSQRFVLFMIAAAGCTYVAWLNLQPERAFEIALAVLASSCPCAFALAAPAALQAGHSAMLRLGLLSTRANDVRTLATIGSVVFDKTGTLTESRLEIAPSASAIDSEELARLVLNLERGSAHPLARAFRHHYAQQSIQDTRVTQAIADWREHTGQGVEARLIDPRTNSLRTYRLGRRGFALGDLDDGTVVLSVDQQWLASFVWREKLRPDAAEARASLRALGIPCVILSGDCASKVQAVQQPLQMDAVFSSADPARKLSVVAELKQLYGSVLMVGDGMNDAPVLAAADASIALANGSAMAVQHADWVLTRNQLSVIAPAVILARATERVLQQNLAWAAIYNLSMLPIAATGHLQPWQAALGMALSSLLVTANAMRLRAPLQKPSVLPLQAPTQQVQFQ